MLQPHNTKTATLHTALALCFQLVIPLFFSILHSEYFGEFDIVESPLSICERSTKQSINL